VSNLAIESVVPPEGQAARVAVLPKGGIDAPEKPAETAVARETVRLALAALMCVPSRQRAALILRDVSCWKAAEVAGSARGRLERFVRARG
jgi:RNA polymerase sigma-70 factor, ECF subfamily